MRMVNRKKKFMILCVFLLAVPFCLSYDQVVVNSRDWQDVYSGMLYSKLTGSYGSYVIEEGHGQMLLEYMPRDQEEVLLIESAQNPYIRNFRTNLESRGFDVDMMGARDDLNLEVARLVNVTGYIIIDEDYSYDAVSVAPYASLKRFYVIFCDNENLDEVFSFLSSQGNPDVILYGYLDREVSERLSGFNPTVINEGDKFSNNLEIVKMFFEEKSTGQLILTDGTFLEPQFFAGNYPVLFIGRSNVLDSTVDFVKESGVKYGMLVGYDNFNNAVTLKNRADLKVIVKFAKGYDQQQYALDIYKLPQAIYDVAIVSANYNRLTKKLEVSYENKVDFPVLVKSSHNILLNDDSVGVVGDQSPFYLDSMGQKTVAYDMDVGSVTDDDFISLESELLYGADIRELEYRSEFNVEVAVISIEDNSRIELAGLVYNKPKKRFFLTVRNPGEDVVYVKPEISDILINEREETLTAEQAAIEPEESYEFRIKADLSPADIEDNEIINLNIFYGSRPDALVLFLEESAELEVSYITDEFLMWIYAGAGTVIVVLVLLAVLILLRRKPKRKGHSVPAPRPVHRPVHHTGYHQSSHHAAPAHHKVQQVHGYSAHRLPKPPGHR